MRAVACVVVVAALALGCATRTTSHFAALSTERVPFINYETGDRRVPDVAAEIVTHQIFWIPTNTRTPTLEATVDAALQRGGGNVIEDAEVEYWWVWVPFLYGQEGWRVRGDVVRRKEPE